MEFERERESVLENFEIRPDLGKIGEIEEDEGNQSNSKFIPTLILEEI